MSFTHEYRRMRKLGYVATGVVEDMETGEGLAPMPRFTYKGLPVKKEALKIPKRAGSPCHRKRWLPHNLLKRPFGRRKHHQNREARNAQ